ncbi:sulfotransferase domain-containing protein [Lacinutrix iliipiscaria]|uniref:Sulfotransferase domain-containing protein n=1 Tax=Lacinutrix iliipiscaria TaxID=1230532 RepID=A0ABW5WJ32_9FLAO
MKVNTFIIGVQKAGTTSLYEWLIQHQDIYGESALKDYPFFIDKTLYSKGTSFFENQFRHLSNEKVVISGCVDYIENPDSLERIKNYNPEAKIILLLRKPEDRIRSAFKFLRQLSKEENDDINKAIEQNKEYIERSLYGKKLEYLYRIFNKNNINIIFFEELIKNPEEVVDKTLNFLGLETKEVIKIFNANKTKNVRFKSLNKVLFDKNSNNFIRSIFKKLFSSNTRVKIRRAIKDLNTQKKSELIKQELNSQYKDLFKEDLMKIKKYIQIDETW